MIKSSAILPFRNARPHLATCLRQTRVCVEELMVWDDMSNDGSSEDFENFHKEHINSRIFAIKGTVRAHVGAIRETLYQLSRGQIILFQDADDERAIPQTQRHIQMMLDNPSIDVLVTPHCRIMNDGSRVMRPLVGDVISDIALNNIQTCALYFNRGILDRVRPFPVSMSWEHHLLYECIKHGAKIDYSPFPAAYWRFRWSENQLSTSANPMSRNRYNLLKTILKEQDLSSEQYNFVMQAVNSYTEEVVANV